MTALLVVFGASWAAETKVSASGGYLSAANVNGSGYVTILGGIEDAQIALTAASGVGNNNPPALAGPQDKFAAGPSSREFAGESSAYQAPSSSASSSSDGFSVVSGAYGYDARWDNLTAAAGESAASDSGTYDPYPVSQADLTGAGLGGTINLYYQSSLGQGTGFNTTPGIGERGVFTFLTYLQDGNGYAPFLDIDAYRFENGDYFMEVDGFGLSNLEIYLLDPSVATDPNAAPDQKIAASGTDRVDLLEIRNLLEQDLERNGILDQTYYFGFLVRNYQVTGNVPGDNTNVFRLHTETFANSNVVAPVPEPTTALVLLPALALLRRRRK